MKQEPRTNMEQTLLQRLTTADLVCSGCGNKYGKYSVGCSTFYTGTCQVCGITGAVTETRDFGYLQPGIDAEKTKIKGQSREVAEYMASLEEYEGDQLASYELGEICLMLTKEEAIYLHNCLDTLSLAQVEEEDTYVFVSLETKIDELYRDHCWQIKLDPVVKAYYEKYNSFAATNEAETERFQKFKDNYQMLVELGFVKEEN